jgi:PAS domain S-box-containing protein
MNPVLYIGIISAILNGYIAFYVYLLNPKKITNIVFAIIVLLFAIFSLGEFIARLSDTKDLALIGGRICYSVLPIACCFGIHFSIVFPRKYPDDKNIFSRNKTSLITLYIVGLLILILFNIFVSIRDVQMSEWGYRVDLNSSTIILIYWFIFCAIYASGSILHTYFKKNITVIEKKQIKFVIITFLVVIIFSLGSNLIPPLVDISVFPMASLSFTIFSLIVVFSMKRYKLMAITTVETLDVVVDTMNDSLIVVDENGIIVKVNKSLLNLLNYNKNDIIGLHLKQIVKSPGKRNITKKNFFKSSIFNNIFIDNKRGDAEIEFVTKNGKIILMNVSASIIYSENKKKEGIVISARDLTDLKRLIKDLEEVKNKLEDKVLERTKELQIANKELENKIIERKKIDEGIRASLKEKEALLREIHHRVKNNLQIVTSLLDLQSGRIKEKSSLDAFKESQNRIKSMSLIHEQLYQSKNLSKIDFEKYIKDLTVNLLYLYNGNPDDISMKINVKNVFMSIGKAIPCGLIINELVSNSLKHAFPDGKQGEILIDISLEDDNNYTLIVKDNGIGLPEKYDYQNSDTLGLQLTDILTQQLKGHVEIDKNHGTTFKITFPNLNFKNEEGG